MSMINLKNCLQTVSYILFCSVLLILYTYVQIYRENLEVKFESVKILQTIKNSDSLSN